LFSCDDARLEAAVGTQPGTPCCAKPGGQIDRGSAINISVLSFARRNGMGRDGVGWHETEEASASEGGWTQEFLALRIKEHR